MLCKSMAISHLEKLSNTFLSYSLNIQHKERFHVLYAGVLLKTASFNAAAFDNRIECVPRGTFVFMPDAVQYEVSQSEWKYTP